jgi:PTH1 family peptidyl-tRNA hydrolase
MKLIFAQGNPGPRYARTRHNTGIATIEAFAAAHDAQWRDMDKFRARITEVLVDSEKVMLVQPLSFYNETGLTARLLIDYYKLDPASDVLVIHDDLALPFGTLRIRGKGSDAGNNGIKSLNTHIGEQYQRLRVGIWNEQRDLMDDADFVLGTFNKEEHDKLTSDIVPKAVELIETFISDTLQTTSHKL